MNDAEQQAGLAPTPGYQYARRVGKQLFVSGQVPNDADGQIVGPDDPAVQARQCLKNLNTLLRVHGFGPADVQQLVVHVVGERANLTAAWQAITEAYPDGVPPATLLGVPVLGYAEQLVEIDATIIKS